MPDEQDIQLALQYYEDTEGCTIRAAARRYGIPPTTLFRRSKGHPSFAQSRSDLQVISPAVEDELIKWLEHMGRVGFPPKGPRIRGMVTRITGIKVGVNWVQRFKNRHASVFCLRASALEKERADVRPASIQVFFDHLEAEIKHYKVSDENIWNMDETGIKIGETSRFSRVFLSGVIPDQPVIYSTTTGENISVIECVNVRGESTPPVFLTKGKVFTQSILPGDDLLRENFLFALARTETSFSTREYGLEWLRKIFIPYTRRNLGGKEPWKILILDGHASHILDEIFDLAYFNRVILLFLPGHATHILQPLDLRIFAVLKKKFREMVYTQNSLGELHLSVEDFYRG